MTARISLLPYTVDSGPVGRPFVGWDDWLATAGWFSGELRRPVQLLLTGQGRTMVYYRYSQAGIRLRLHRLFLAAGAAEAQALVRYVRGDVDAGAIVDRFIAQQVSQEAPAPGERLAPRGRAHDVGALFDQLNSDFFHGACGARVTWGRASRRPRRGVRRLSLFLLRRRLIVVHPCLDSVQVPAFYLTWLIYREMLHELFLWDDESPSPRPKPPELSVLETCHPGWARSQTWAGQHLERLLAAATVVRPTCGMRRLAHPLPPAP